MGLNEQQFGQVIPLDPVGLGVNRVRGWLAERHSQDWVKGNVFERGAGHFDAEESDRGQRHVIMEGSPGWVDDAWVASRAATGDPDYEGRAEQPLALPKGVGVQPYNDYTLSVYREANDESPTSSGGGQVVPFADRRRR